MPAGLPVRLKSYRSGPWGQKRRASRRHSPVRDGPHCFPASWVSAGRRLIHRGALDPTFPAADRPGRPFHPQGREISAVRPVGHLGPPLGIVRRGPAARPRRVLIDLVEMDRRFSTSERVIVAACKTSGKRRQPGSSLLERPGASPSREAINSAALNPARHTLMPSR